MTTDIQLTPNFKLSEFTRSARAKKLGIKNEPTTEEIERIKLWCIYIGEPVRKHFGKPVSVSSGFRSEKLNAATPGSSKTSQHRLGEAADIKVAGVPNVDVFNYIRDHLIFDQLIAEYLVKSVKDAGWVHVSYTERKPCRMDVKSAVRNKKTGKVEYHKGLVIAA